MDVPTVPHLQIPACSGDKVPPERMFCFFILYTDDLWRIPVEIDSEYVKS